MLWTPQLTEIGHDGQSVRPELLGDGVVLQARAPGRDTVQLRGTVELDRRVCDQPAGSRLPIVVNVDVQVREVVASRFSVGCPGPAVVAVGQVFRRDLGLLGVELLDPEGNVVPADNVGPIPDDLVLRGRFADDVPSLDQLDHWTAPSVPGTVEMRTSLGGLLVVEVVGPQSIVDGDVSFEIGFIKAPSLPLEPGRAYRPEDLVSLGSGATNELMPRVTGLDTPVGLLCSAPPSDWFELVSTSPDVCQTLAPQPGFGGISVGPGRLPLGAQIIEDGTCELELRAPELGTEAGFPARWSATFLDTDGLAAW